ncbi:MAG: FAD-dependent oxidoreductase [Pseudomonadales bacterium]|nr:FAD-dependent oxidoreductase [Pseudomonadales bacterium]
MRELTTDCCIAGGGPAGMVLGYLLARQGVDVIVLEKHGDFLRDFRGDTVHPSTLQAFHEMGVLDRLLERPHQRTETVSVIIEGRPFRVADFRRLPVVAPYIAMMPQWDFLDRLAEAGRGLPGFRLLMSAEAMACRVDAGAVTGIDAVTADGPMTIHASLTVAADGRASRLRDDSGLPLRDIGAPIDVFWFQLSRRGPASAESLGRVSQDGVLVLINRGDYWQCALPFPKGSEAALRAAGLPAFRERIARIAPNLAESVAELDSWEVVMLLSVQVNRLERWWRDGLLFIGDAAHAMSPVGGVGINLAVQDAIAAARILGTPLRDGTLTTEHLAAVQRRRERPAQLTQAAQVFAHKRVLVPALSAAASIRPPLLLRLLQWLPVLQRLPARAIGMGLRPEHWDARLDWKYPAGLDR